MGIWRIKGSDSSAFGKHRENLSFQRNSAKTIIFQYVKLILFVVWYIIYFIYFCQSNSFYGRSRAYLGGLMMEYCSIRQISEKWGISVRRIQVLCVENRIPGAVKIGYSWVIPADAEKPKDARVKSGKYIKSGIWPN